MDSLTRSPKEEFSPLVAIALSLPLVAIMGLLFGPSLWDGAAGLLGVTAPNLPQLICDALPGTFGLWIAASLLIFCPAAMVYGWKTTGHTKSRMTFALIHTAALLLLLFG